MKYTIPEMKVTYVVDEDIIVTSSVTDMGAGDGNTDIGEVPLPGEW